MQRRGRPAHGLRPHSVLQSHGGGNGTAEQNHIWTAPANRRYVFDTVGSALDTVLVVRDGCSGPELGCDDDSGGGTASRLEIALAEGQEVIVVVDGKGGAEGAYVLNIN